VFLDFTHRLVSQEQRDELLCAKIKFSLKTQSVSFVHFYVNLSMIYALRTLHVFAIWAELYATLSYTTGAKRVEVTEGEFPL
jgi:hypothetical protein